MPRFLLLLLILVVISVNGWAATKAEDKNALDAAMASVDAAERRFFEREGDVRTDLLKTLDTLERLISSNGLDGRNLFEAMLYRAHAHRILNSARARDRVAGRQGRGAAGDG